MRSPSPTPRILHEAGQADGLNRFRLSRQRLPRKPWTLKDGKPCCMNCGSLLKPVDEPVSLKCTGCGRAYPLTEDDLKALMFDLMD